MNKENYIVYARTDVRDRILEVNSSAFLTDAADWTSIDEGLGDKYHHAQGNYFPSPLYTADGIPRYKLEDGKAVERTAQEIAADRAAVPPARPSALEQLRADVDFLAIMQGVEL